MSTHKSFVAGLDGAVVPTVIRSADGLNRSSDPLNTDADTVPNTLSEPVIDVLLPLSMVDPVTINPLAKLINPLNELAYDAVVANDAEVPTNALNCVELDITPLNLFCI